MGEQYLSPPPFDLAGSHADSSVSQPLVFVLSPGSDPMAALLYFAESVKKNVDSISLGQGQVQCRRRGYFGCNTLRDNAGCECLSICFFSSCQIFFPIDMRCAYTTIMLCPAQYPILLHLLNLRRVILRPVAW